MSTTYTWKVTRLPQIAIDRIADAVISVAGTVTASDGKHEVTLPFNAQLNPTAESVSSLTYVPYDQLTETLVLGWAQRVMGDVQIEAIKRNLDARLAYLENPPAVPVEHPLPWAHA